MANSISIQSAPQAGLAITFQAATSGGDTVANSSSAKLIVCNEGASACTVTIAATGYDEFNNALGGLSLSVAAGAHGIIPLGDAKFATTGGAITVHYSQVSSVTVAAVA